MIYVVFCDECGYEFALCMRAMDKLPSECLEEDCDSTSFNLEPVEDDRDEEAEYERNKTRKRDLDAKEIEKLEQERDGYTRR